MTNNIETLFKIITQSNKIVFLTGAGASTPSGLTDFESIYSKKFRGFNPEDIMTKGFIEQNPSIFLEFIKQNFSYNAQPNICHKIISEIENNWNKDVCIITQNIDGLHQKAGSKKVYEIHGNIKNWYCTDCKDKKSIDQILKSNSLNCNDENCNGLYRPNIILYGETFNSMTLKLSNMQLNASDTLIVIGTRINTMFTYQAIKNFKGKFVFLNKKPLNESLPRKADLEIYDDVKNIFSQLSEVYNEKNLDY